MRVSQPRIARPRSSKTMGDAGRIVVSQRASTVIALAALGALTLAGCAGSPERQQPSESPGFSSEQEAQSAAEKTYSAYIAATNQADPARPDTAEPMYAWLTGAALPAARETMSTAQAEGVTRTGDSVITLFELSSADLETMDIVANACLDVSAVEVTNADGDSVADPDRKDVQQVRVTLTRSDSTSTGLAIADTTGREEGPSCDG